MQYEIYVYREKIVLLLYVQFCIMKKKICMRKEHCHYVKVSKFICENRAGDQRKG